MPRFNTTDWIDTFPLKLYKYKALEPFEYIADIICENRFHTAQFFDLNDPMEGLFDVRGDMKEEYLTRIKEAKEKMRICSFSRTPRHPVLWAHYASDFKGVCIEVELQGTEPGFNLGLVDYTPIRSVVCAEQAEIRCGLPQTLLVSKAKEWRLEQEVRAFAEDEFISCGDSMRITRVLLGLRTPPVIQKLIRTITPTHIQVRRTKIGKQNRIGLGEEILP